MTASGSGRESGWPALAEASGLEVVGYHDLEGNPGFKLAMQEVGDRWFLYLGHFWRTGWSVLDVTDPSAPDLVGWVEGPADTWCLQVQVADGLMLTALERPAPGWGFDLSKVAKTGVLIWDVATDPTHPQPLAHYETGGSGTHRNHYAGGRYAYLAAEPDGFSGNIVVVLDLIDPRRPAEVGRWWARGQWTAGGESADHEHYFHGPAYVVGDLAYLGYGGEGMIILDVSDPTKPELVSQTSFGDLGSKLGCHGVVPYGPGVVVANSEAIAEGGAEPLNYAVTIDVSNPESPRIVGWLPVPRPASGAGYDSYIRKGGRFGPHNQHHFQDQACLADERSRVYLTYFNAGLRVYDISDPADPVETAFLVPADPTVRRGPKPVEALVVQSEDVLVDRRGYIYMTDKNHGLLVLRHTESSS